MKISVIIPFYNAENFLADCLKDLYHQTFKDFEMILIDDYSSDKSPDIAQSFAESLPNAVYHRLPENCGAGAARNKGLELSTGVYVCFIDADDRLDKEHLQYMYSLIQSNTELVISHSPEKLKKSKLEILKQYYRGKISMSVTGKLYSIDFLNKHHIRFTPGILFEDRLFNAKVLYNTPEIQSGSINHYIIQYREDSSMHAIQIKHYEDFQKVRRLEKELFGTDYQKIKKAIEISDLVVYKYLAIQDTNFITHSSELIFYNDKILNTLLDFHFMQLVRWYLKFKIKYLYALS